MHEYIDLVRGIDVGNGAGVAHRQQIGGRDLAGGIEGAQVTAETTHHRQAAAPPDRRRVGWQGRPRQRVGDGDRNRAAGLQVVIRRTPLEIGPRDPSLPPRVSVNLGLLLEINPDVAARHVNALGEAFGDPSLRSIDAKAVNEFMRNATARNDPTHVLDAVLDTFAPRDATGVRHPVPDELVQTRVEGLLETAKMQTHTREILAAEMRGEWEAARRADPATMEVFDRLPRDPNAHYMHERIPEIMRQDPVNPFRDEVRGLFTRAQPDGTRVPMPGTEAAQALRDLFEARDRGPEALRETYDRLRQEADTARPVGRVELTRLVGPAVLTRPEARNRPGVKEVSNASRWEWRSRGLLSILTACERNTSGPPRVA